MWYTFCVGSRLEVSLEKALPRQQWARLVNSSASSDLPISGGLDYDHLSPEELHLLQERIMQVSGRTEVCALGGHVCTLKNICATWKCF